MYTVEVYASGNRNTHTRTFFMSTYSWPAISAALGGIREEFDWRYGDAAGNQCRIREPQRGEILEFKLGTPAQFQIGFTGTLVLSHSDTED